MKAKPEMSKLGLLIALFAVAALQAVQGANAAGSGQEKAAACAACHGAEGNSVNPLWPKLAGQHVDYIVKQLTAFKSGERQEPSMTPMAAPLTPEDMRDIAAFYAGQARRPGVADEKLVNLGQSIYRGGNKATGVPACMACHGPRGSGNPGAGFPVLSGQHPEYTAKQLNAYRSGERSTDPAGMMRSIAKRLSPEEITALASYVSGLH